MSARHVFANGLHRDLFANGLHRDLDAVIASLPRSWSFGPAEIERHPEGDGELLDGW
ncbi:hypothetical protein ACTMTI_52220 [Nonomuraea sp. H19]|uniref:hypothetical protein n=1 Tax=Nonomuraea sp. H19 TaxID=3452206 RepID=UPI003F88A803